MDDHHDRAPTPAETIFAAELFSQLQAADQDALICQIESLLSEQ